MIIDNIEWHYRDNYPEDIDRINAATHIGIFLAWIIENNFESEYLKKIAYNDIKKIRMREITGREFVINNCNKSLEDKFIDKKVLEFVFGYYLSSREDYCQYIADYVEIFSNDDINSTYEVEDRWENYYRVFTIINKRYNEWKVKNR